MNHSIIQFKIYDVISWLGPFPTSIITFKELINVQANIDLRIIIMGRVK
jgi:hypothetical protein